MNEMGADPQHTKPGCFPWSKAARLVHTSLRDWITAYLLSGGLEAAKTKSGFCTKPANVLNHYCCGQVFIL